MTKIFGHVVYVPNRRNHCVCYVRVACYNFTYRFLGGDNRQVTAKIIGDRSHEMRGLQKIAEAPAHNQCNLDPVFAKTRFFELKTDFGKPSCPSVKLLYLRQRPDRITLGNRLGRCPCRGAAPRAPEKSLS